MEFKSTLLHDVNRGSKNEDLRFQVLKTIAAFMNSDGGTLLIGLKDDKEIYGIENDLSYVHSKEEKQNNDGFELHLQNVIGTTLGFAVSRYVNFRFECYGGKTICAVDVLRCPDAVFLKKGQNREFYVRAGNQSRSLNVEEMYAYLRSAKSL